MELSDAVRLELAPISSAQYRHPDADDQRYYACAAALDEFLAGLPADAHNLLVLVDGPPGSTCRYARYPALPHVLPLTRHLNTTFLLDDSHRPDEAAALAQWQQFMREQGIDFTIRGWPSDKGVAEIIVPPAAG